ncbi:MAG: hypothetical protein CMQ61_04565 [Gammaproteobacteria bacterium]|nr:hypothetical protein [Gammaproteobacteria bacterium]
MRFILVVLMLLSIPGVSASELSQQDLAVVKSFGQWPPRPAIDRSNAASGKQSATAFGKALFADPRLSGDGSMSCALAMTLNGGFRTAARLQLDARLSRATHKR